MRIVVFGATDGLGGGVLEEALARGHAASAVGDARDQGAVAAALVGHDAVVSCIGPGGLGGILAGMRAHGVGRIVAVAADGLLQDDAEALLRESGARWTLVCPTALYDGEGTGGYRAERDFLPEGGERIASDDVALFILDELESAAFVGSRVGIAE